MRTKLDRATIVSVVEFGVRVGPSNKKHSSSRHRTHPYLREGFIFKCCNHDHV